MTSINQGMSYVRVTQRSASTGVMQNLFGNLERMGKLQAQLSSGKAIARPSDGPSATLSAMQLRSDMRAEQQYQRNAEDGLGWLNTADTAITTALDMTRRARELTLQAMNSGSSGSVEARDAIAIELENLRDGLIGLANTKYLDRPVFGGTTSGQSAYNPATGAYTGDANAVLRTVRDDGRVRVDTTGPEVFGDGATSLFSVIADLASRARTSPETLGTGLAALDSGMTRLRGAVADVGARAARVGDLKQAAEDRINMLKSQVSEVEDVDLPKTIMDLQLQEVAYQAALGTTSRILQPTLVDFLR